MKIGDRVQHRSGDFIFIGTLLGAVNDRKGNPLWAVEQDGSKYVQLFGEHSLKPLDPKDWFDNIPPAVVPPVYVKPEFPIIINLFERGVPHGANHNLIGFRNRVKKDILPPRPPEALRQEFVKVELDFLCVGNASGDIDNLTKPVLDLLKGSVIVDDRQVRELAVRVRPGQKADSIKITITPYEPKV